MRVGDRRLAGLRLANPTLTCSGTCGYAFEYADFMDLSKLGAFVTKSITREERAGNEPSRRSSRSMYRPPAIQLLSSRLRPT